MKMGAALPLVPPVKTESIRREERDELPQNMERPKGRILFIGVAAKLFVQASHASSI